MPLIPLSKSHIQTALKTNLNQPIDIYLFDTIDSTNRFLKKLSSTSRLTCCLAETQTAGRGRFGRVWHSPFGENIYCSLRLRVQSKPAHLSGLSLVVSLAMHAVLQKYTPDPITIKWPNDLLWQHKKLAGTLIEILTEGNHTDVIIGMGLNINHTSKTWCSLKEITHQSFDRNQLIIELILALEKQLQVLEQKGFVAFEAAWNAHDYLYNQTITLSNPNGSFTGKARGVNHKGCLLLEDNTGVIHSFSSGDTTLAQENT